MNAEDIARSFDFGTYWMTIVGDRQQGKTTALKLLYDKAAAQDQRAVFVVPDAPTAKALTRSGRIKQSDVFTAFSLQYANGMRPYVMLIDAWLQLPARSRVRLVRGIKMLRPTYVFITGGPLISYELAIDRGNFSGLWLHDVEPEPVYARSDSGEITDYILRPR